MHNEFPAVIESAEVGGFIAFCLEESGANGKGERGTVQEEKQKFAEAIELILMDRREDGLRGVAPDAVKEIVTIG